MGKLSFEKRIERNNWPIKIILVLLALMVVSGVYNSGKKMLVSMILKTAPANFETIQSSVKGEGLVFPHEEVIYAPYSGTVKYFITASKRVALGERIANFEAFGTTSEGKKVTKTLIAPMTGMVTFWWDGMEALFTEEILATTNIDKLISAPTTRQMKNTVGSGEPIAKIVDNLKNINYVVSFTGDSFKTGPTIGEEFNLVIANTKAHGLVKDVKKSNDSIYLLFELDVLPDNFFKNRRLPCILIKNEYNGVKLPKEAIIKKNNQPGVYTLIAGQVEWKEVQLEKNFDTPFVTDGLNSSDIIILNPKWVSQNDFVN